MRRPFDALALAVRERLALDSKSGVLFVFSRKQSNRLKVIWFDPVSAGGICDARGIFANSEISTTRRPFLLPGDSPPRIQGEPGTPKVSPQSKVRENSARSVSSKTT